MNFIELSISYEYLYSPKSWLHFESDTIKINLLFLQLICLPFTPLRYIVIIFIVLFCVYKSIKIPKYLKNYFYKSILLFIALLLLSIKNGSQLKKYKLNNKQVWRVYPFCYLSRVNTATVDEFRSSFLYLQVSVLRFISIHAIYLIIVRYFLLTTKQESLAKTLLTASPIKNLSDIKFIFIIMTSSQFLKIVFKQLKQVKTSYNLRCMKINQYNVRAISIVLTSFLEELLVILDYNIWSPAYALQNRDIKK